MLTLPPLVSEEVFRQRLAAFESWLWGDGSYALGWRHAPRPSVLARRVIELSDLYTTGRQSIADESATGEHLLAKVFYFLVSDASKPVMVLRELAARYPSLVVSSSDQTLRVCDAGAGVGATAVGFLLSLDASRIGAIEITGIDGHARSLEVWPIVAEKAAAIAGVRLTARPVVRNLMEPVSLSTPPDLFIAQALMNELFPTSGADGETKDSAHRRADWMAAQVGGALGVIVEPALHETTRPLHTMRDELLSRGGWRVLAPCPHAMPCPMLVSQRDWCHEVHVFDPMPRVAEVQNITRRRDSRTKFSFVAMARETQTWASGVAGASLTGRLVSDALNSKGKMERYLCNVDGRIVQLRLLDRDRNDANRVLADAPRGTMVTIAGCEEPPRVRGDAVVTTP